MNEAAKTVLNLVERIKDVSCESGIDEGRSRILPCHVGSVKSVASARSTVYLFRDKVKAFGGRLGCQEVGLHPLIIRKPL